MIVALAQISPTLGEVEKNVGLHAEIIEKARKERADLVVFPELSLTGYHLRDLTAQVALNPEKDKRFRELVSLSRAIDLVLGFVEDNKSGLLYNAAAFLGRGHLIHLHRKVYLPTYGMFDEARFFAQGKEFQTFASPLGTTGLLICREFLHLSAGYMLQVGGAELVIVISAAPGRGVSLEGKTPSTGRRSSSDALPPLLGRGMKPRPATKGTTPPWNPLERLPMASHGANSPLATQGRGFDTSRMWEQMGETLSFFSSSYVLYCNRAGVEDGMIFAGGSFLYNPLGRLVAKAAYAQKDFLLAEIKPGEVQRARRTWPWVRDDKPEVILLALQKALSRHEN